MARSWKQITNSLYFRDNRPQWLIAPLPVPPAMPQAPAYSASALVGGLIPNVAQDANNVARYDNSPSSPYFSQGQFDAAQDYTNRVMLSPIGGPYDG